MDVKKIIVSGELPETCAMCKFAYWIDGLEYACTAIDKPMTHDELVESVLPECPLELEEVCELCGGTGYVLNSVDQTYNDLVWTTTWREPCPRCNSECLETEY